MKKVLFIISFSAAAINFHSSLDFLEKGFPQIARWRIERIQKNYIQKSESEKLAIEDTMEKKCRKNVLEYCVAVAKYKYSRNDLKTTQKILQYGCDKDLPIACTYKLEVDFKLGQKEFVKHDGRHICHKKELSSVEKNQCLYYYIVQLKELSLFTKPRLIESCLLHGKRDACFHLGNHLNVKEKDFQAAIPLYKKGCIELGDYRSCKNLAFVAFKIRDYEQVANVAFQYCNKKDGYFCYLNSLIEEKRENFEDAQKLMSKSCDIGFEKACQKLRVTLENVATVTPDSSTQVSSHP